MRINMFNSGKLSMERVRKIANHSFPTVTLGYDDCCKLAAEALMSSHVTQEELNQIFLGIKRVFRVETVDVKRFLPKREDFTVRLNAVARWASAESEIKNGLIALDWEI